MSKWRSRQASGETRQLPVPAPASVTPSLLTAHHSPRIPTDGLALPGPCFGTVEAEAHGLVFRRRFCLNSMIIVLLIGRQQANKSAAALWQAYYLKCDRAEIIEATARIDPVRAAVFGQRFAHAQCLGGR